LFFHFCKTIFLETPLLPRTAFLRFVEKFVTIYLSCTNFNSIIDNIPATNEKICSGFGHDESGIVSDLNEIVTNFSTNLRNAVL
jgi:hypothetical protein